MNSRKKTIARFKIMKVKEIIEKLQTAPPEAEVQSAPNVNGGVVVGVELQDSNVVILISE